MATSRKSTGETLFDLTFSAEAIHVNPLAFLDNAKAKTTQGIYGHGYERPLATYDLSTQSWKMYGDISLWEEPQSLESLPPSGISQSGELFERPPLELNTKESDSLLWPTPTTHGEIIGTRIEAHRKRLEAGMKYSSRLTQAIALRYPEDIGYLSPMWTELLMGFPPGWTDLEDSETP